MVLSESAAILVYLAKKSSRMIPGDRAGEAQVVRWCFAAMNSVEPPLLALMVLDWTADGSCGKHREFLVGWANRVLKNRSAGSLTATSSRQRISPSPTS